MNYVLQLCYIFQTNKGRSKVTPILEHCLLRQRDSGLCHVLCLSCSIDLSYFPSPLFSWGHGNSLCTLKLDTWPAYAFFPFLYQTLSCSFKPSLTLLWFLFLWGTYTNKRSESSYFCFFRLLWAVPKCLKVSKSQRHLQEDEWISSSSSKQKGSLN